MKWKNKMSLTYQILKFRHFYYYYHWGNIYRYQVYRAPGEKESLRINTLIYGSHTASFCGGLNSIYDQICCERIFFHFSLFHEKILFSTFTPTWKNSRVSFFQLIAYILMIRNLLGNVLLLQTFWSIHRHIVYRIYTM